MLRHFTFFVVPSWLMFRKSPLLALSSFSSSIKHLYRHGHSQMVLPNYLNTQQIWHFWANRINFCKTLTKKGKMRRFLRQKKKRATIRQKYIKYINEVGLSLHFLWLIFWESFFEHSGLMQEKHPLKGLTFWTNKNHHFLEVTNTFFNVFSPLKFPAIPKRESNVQIIMFSRASC